MQEYNLNKSIEATLYICEKLKSVGKHKLNKLFYFADKHHLENYGRTVTGDVYKKLKYGPVAKNTYEHIGFSPFINDVFEIKHHTIKAKRKADLDELSESDLQSIDFAIENYGDLSFEELLEISHDETWHSAKMREIFTFDQFLLSYPDKTRKEIEDYLSN